MKFSQAQINIARWLLHPDNPSAAPTDPSLLEAQIRENGLEKVYWEIEVPLIPILEKMHKTGIKVDVKKLEKLSASLEKEIKSLTKKIYKLAGTEFNLNSPKQLSFILFERLKINENGVGRVKTGARRTDAETLETIKNRHPIIQLILRYRELFKIKSTYVDPLKTMAEADPENRVHTTFIQTGTATGRLSSQNPNLQNIPIFSELGTKIREAFTAEKGYELAAFDYSQIELRILAAESQDEKMMDVFKKDKDIHAATAAKVFHTTAEKVSKEQRRFAKTLNFGIVYGMGPKAFARSAGITNADAKKFIEEYFNNFPNIKKWQKFIIQEVRKKGYAENRNGRKRWLPAINSTDPRLAAEAERAAINMPIQSLAADIIKLAMIRLDRLIQQKMFGDKLKMLLTIHDELIFEIKKTIIKSAMPLIKKEMELVYDLGVPLKVEAAHGKNWAELK